MSARVQRDVGRGNVVWYDRHGFIVRIRSWRTRLLAARRRVPKPTFFRYIRHDTWHVCQEGQRDLAFDDARWIDVAW